MNRTLWRASALAAALTAALLIPQIISRAEPARPASAAPAGRYAALTFDDGPRRDTTPLLLEGLRRRGVKATFFLIGRQAAECPDLVKQMADEGHQLGVHTWDHVSLRGLSPEETDRQLGRTKALLTRLAGPEDFMLRPPYGFADEELKSRAGMPIIGWSVDTEDWKHHDPAALADKILRETEDGSIILMHDIYPASVEAALAAADRLLEEGYWLVTVEELFALRGEQPRAGEVCHALPPDTHNENTRHEEDFP